MLESSEGATVKRSLYDPNGSTTLPSALCQSSDWCHLLNTKYIKAKISYTSKWGRCLQTTTGRDQGPGHDQSFSRAEVIKIEHPTRGDDTRAWGPPYAAFNESSGLKGPGESAYYLSHESGVDILHKLASDCDVLVENYLPGALKKYRMDYESIANINPRLVYASITGEMGLMHITGHRDGPPAKVGVAITDLTTGLYTCNSVMAALIGRGRTGKGQHLDVALSDCQVASLTSIASSCLISGKPDSGRWGTAHPSIVPYKGFKTKDGDVMLGGGNDRLFGIMCKRLGKPEWTQDHRFVTNAERVKNRVELERLVEGITVSKTTQEWLDILDGSGLPYAAINDIKATMEHEHVLARGMVQEVDHPSCGPMKLLSPPVKFSASNPSIRTPPPTLGQHTDEILINILGMSKSEVIGLKEQGIVA
nr:succinate--hydroxymethylglutarate coa-transferase [Quercus suber]